MSLGIAEEETGSRKSTKPSGQTGVESKEGPEGVKGLGLVRGRREVKAGGAEGGGAARAGSLDSGASSSSRFVGSEADMMMKVFDR